MGSIFSVFSLLKIISRFFLCKTMFLVGDFRKAGKFGLWKGTQPKLRLPQKSISGYYLQQAIMEKENGEEYFCDGRKKYLANVVS